MVEGLPFCGVELVLLCYSKIMKEHEENIETLRYMLSVLMVRQSSWHLNEDERLRTQQGIKALQAAVEAMDTQIYA